MAINRSQVVTLLETYQICTRFTHLCHLFLQNTNLRYSSSSNKGSVHSEKTVLSFSLHCPDPERRGAEGNSQSSLQRWQLSLLGWQEAEPLEERGEIEEQFHPGQGLAQTHAATCGGDEIILIETFCLGVRREEREREREGGGGGALRRCFLRHASVL